LGIRPRGTGIAIGALLAHLCVQPAKADEFNFTFTPNQAECAKGYTACTVFGSGTFTVGPPQNDPNYYGAMPITAMTGTLNGSSAMSFVLQGFPALSTDLKIAPAPWNYPVIFMANGQQWAFIHYDTYPNWYSFLVNYNTNTSEPIDLVITAPEPSALALLGVGLLGLMGLTLLKNRLS